MASHPYVAENERFGKLDCRYCRQPEEASVHRSLVEQIVADSGKPVKTAGAPLASRMGPDVKARMEALIGRQATPQPQPHAELVESAEDYKRRMMPTSRAAANAPAIVDVMARLAPAFGVKRKPWAELSVYDQALWIATLREAGIA